MISTAISWLLRPSAAKAAVRSSVRTNRRLPIETLEVRTLMTSVLAPDSPMEPVVPIPYVLFSNSLEPRYTADSVVFLGDKAYHNGRDANGISQLFEFDQADADGQPAERAVTNFRWSVYPTSIIQVTLLDGQIYFQTKNSQEVQLWKFDPAANQGAGEATLLHRFEGFQPGETIPEAEGMLTENGKLYFELQKDGQAHVWTYEPASAEPLQPIDAIPQHLMEQPPVEQPWDAGILIPSGLPPIIRLRLGFPVENRWTHERTVVDIQLTRDPSLPLGAKSSGLPLEPGQISSSNRFNEWEEVPGELWVTVGADMKSGPVDLNWVMKSKAYWLDDPEMVAAIGDASLETVTDENGVRVTTGTLHGIDLSGYAIGDRVLVARFVQKPNADDPVGIAIQSEGYYPTPETNVMWLDEAQVSGNEESAMVSPTIAGEFHPVAFDTNDDGRIDRADLDALLEQMAKGPLAITGDEGFAFDFNHDLKVGLVDFSMMTKEIGKSKPVTAPPTSASDIPATPEEDPYVYITGFNAENEWEVFHVPKSVSQALIDELDGMNFVVYEQLPISLPRFGFEPVWIFPIELTEFNFCGNRDIEELSDLNDDVDDGVDEAS
ncbi:hypothetical protein AB1L30_02315 [Bremerella sp. JC817]|uniref:hypothetical protein n=1 Tax=Bremerella sp. JC817 TaxID=3231756 RepID=UPI00345B4078